MKKLKEYLIFKINHLKFKIILPPSHASFLRYTNLNSMSKDYDTVIKQIEALRSELFAYHSEIIQLLLQISGLEIDEQQEQ